MRTIANRLDVRAEVLKALAHPTRLHLVEQLADGERCVCDLNAGVDADLSTVSRHLRVLRTAGLVACDKRGAKVFYRLRAPCVLQFFDCLEAVLTTGTCEMGTCATDACDC